jgi:hypothetical protein
MIAPAPGKAVVLNGEELSTDGRVLERVRMGLTVGDLTFKVEFLPTNAASYNGQLNEIVQESRTWSAERIKSINSTPSTIILYSRGIRYKPHTPLERTEL